jgi:hypothetical protein
MNGKGKGIGYKLNFWSNATAFFLVVSNERSSAAFLVLLGEFCVFRHLDLGELHVARPHVAGGHLVALVDLLNQVAEGLVDVLARERTDGKELAVILGLQLINFLLVLLQLLVETDGREQVALVAQQQLGDVVAAVQDELLQPGLGVGERVLVGEVKHHAGGLGQREVVVYDGSVAFLAGGVPEFEVEGGVGIGHLLEAVVDADGGLLRVELSVHVAQQQRALAHCRPPDDDRLVVLQAGVLKFTHNYRIYH